MKPNNGHQPATSHGKRVHVILRNGYDTRVKEPAGWAADGMRWWHVPGPFDVMQWEIVT
jgi:hypothetical protein